MCYSFDITIDVRVGVVRPNIHVVMEITSSQKGFIMRKLAFGLVLVFFTAAFSFAFDEDDLNLITFENLTRRTIEFIFLSPGDSEYWGPEILGSERVLESRDSLGFWILYPEECNTFDIMAIDEDGGTLIIYDYEICDGSDELIEFVNKDMVDDAPDLEFVTIYIENDTLPIYYIFISPSDSEYWGVDYLDETTILEMEESVSFLFPISNETIEFDLMAVDEDFDEYQFSFDVDEDSDEYTFAIEISDLVY